MVCIYVSACGVSIFYIAGFACLLLVWCSCHDVMDEHHHVKSTRRGLSCKRKPTCYIAQDGLKTHYSRIGLFLSTSPSPQPKASLLELYLFTFSYHLCSHFSEYGNFLEKASPRSCGMIYLVWRRHTCREHLWQWHISYGVSWNLITSNLPPC